MSQQDVSVQMLAELLANKPTQQRRYRPRLGWRALVLILFGAALYTVPMALTAAPSQSPLGSMLIGILLGISFGMAFSDGQTHQGERLILRGIYCITCLANNATYVGSTQRNFYQRWGQHVVDLAKGKHTNQRLQREWDYYGPVAFQFRILEVIEDATAIAARERELLEHRAHQLPAIRNYNIAHSRTYPVKPMPEAGA